LGSRGFSPVLAFKEVSTMAAKEQQPIACTLLGEARQDRLGRIAALMCDALLTRERDDLTLRLRFAPDAVQLVRDMVRMEQACCGFVTFEMEERPKETCLTITEPEAARAAADELFGQFASAVRNSIFSRRDAAGSP
jgi:hypothetical protein